MSDLQCIISLLSFLTCIEFIRLVMAVFSRLRSWLKERKAKK